MNETNFSKKLQFKPCSISIKYIIKPFFKITSIQIESFLEDQTNLVTLKDNYHPHERLSKILLSIQTYFKTGQPIEIKLEEIDMEQISPFYRMVLETLFLKVPHGKIVTYHHLAELSGNAKASRAVGTAMARNPFPLLIPCHRVIKSDLTLGNYAFGKRLKLFLLRKEIPDSLFINSNSAKVTKMHLL